MGILSRNLFPVCESTCICCPALRSRSRQPIKRYKKLLAEIFPKSLNEPPNDRKIGKLCEYAAKNPFRIPKIAKYLEDQCFKELRTEHIKYINVVTDTYNKLLCMCKEQMAYFAVSLLNVVNEVLDKSKQDTLLVLGCQILTTFIYNQVDGTYTHNIEKLVHKVCKLAREDGDERGNRLKAASLQCLSAMVWFMSEFSYIFDAFDEIVHVTLDNYDADIHKCRGEIGEPHHNWVSEVVRCEGKGAADPSSGALIVRPRPEKKDPSRLTREEIETPRVWAQICVQRLVELAKESTTMCLVLDSMFSYFDLGRHWKSQCGLAVTVLSDMSCLLEGSGHQQLILSGIIRHLDHKNVAHDPQLKSNIIQVAMILARQIRSRAALAEIGFVSDLCRHLRKSLQASADSSSEQAPININLQNSIEDCLLEIAKGIGDARPLFDMMTIALEKVPSYGVVARATIGSLQILAHTISSVIFLSHQVFPDALLLQLLKLMLHPDVEARVGAHKIFSAIVVQCCNHSSYEATSVVSGYSSELGRLRSSSASAVNSVSTLLDKLRREKDGPNMSKHGSHAVDDCKENGGMEEWKQGWIRKNSPNYYKLSSIIDRTKEASELEPCIMNFSEDQISQLLSAFWVQANLPDNMPSNFEAIAYSFSLVLISSRLKIPNDNLMVQFFRLSLSLRNSSIFSSNGMLPAVCQRSIFVLSTVMLMFAAKMYQITDLTDFQKWLMPQEVDPFLSITDDCRLQVKPQEDLKVYGSAADNQQAMTVLLELSSKVYESDKVFMDRLILNLSTVTELDVDELSRKLSEPFTPDEAFMFVPQSVLDVPNQTICQSHDSLSFDEDIRTSSLIEDDAISEASVTDQSRYIPKIPASPTVSHVISIGKLLETVLEVAGQVAGTSVSTSPLPYDTMAKQCESFGMSTRKKLSNWLAHEGNTRSPEKLSIDSPANGNPAPWKVALKPADPTSTVRLPPASPFNNFLKAAGG